MGVRIEKQGGGVPLKRRLRNGLLAVLAVYLAGWAIVNLVANSAWARQKIGNHVQAVVGTPLEVGRIVVTPWGALRLKDLKIEATTDTEGNGNGDAIHPLFESRELRVNFALLSLFSKSIKIKSVEVREPVFSLVREEGGGFVLPPGLQGYGAVKMTPVNSAGNTITATEPGGEVAGGAGAQGEVVIAGSQRQPGLPLQDGGPDTLYPGFAIPGGGTAGVSPEVVAGREGGESAGGVPVPGAKRPPTKPIEIRYGSRSFFFSDVMMRRGLMQVFSIDGERNLLRVEDMTMRVAVQREGPLKGTFEAAKAVLFDEVEVESLRSDVATDGMLFKFTKFEAEMSGGRLEGQFNTSPFYPGIPFASTLQVMEIDIPELSAKILPELEFDSGAAEGALTMIGHLRIPSSYSGKGEFKMNDVHLKRNGMLDSIAGSIDVSGLQDIDFDEALLRFSVGGGNVRVDEVRVSSPEIVLAGRGFVDLTGKLSFASRLYVNEHAHHAITMIEERLPEGVEMGYVPAGSDERFYRDYLIGGYVQNPVINFWKGAPAVRAFEIREQILKLLEAPKSG